MLLLATTATATVWRLRPVDPAVDALPLAVLLVMGVASAGLRTNRNEEHVTFSFTAVVLLAGIVLVGPGAAALVGAATALLDSQLRWGLGHVFNAAMLALITATGGFAYYLAGGRFLGVAGVGDATSGLGAAQNPDPGRLVESLGMPLLAADIALMATNVIVLVLMSAPKADDIRALLMSSLVYTVPLYLGYAIIAFILVVLWVPAGVGPLAAGLITAPLLVTRWVHTQYAEERRAQRRILDALVHTGAEPQAVEHSARVAQIADAMGARLGLGVRARARLRHAARLHAIGTRRACTPPPCDDTAQSVRESVGRARVAHEIVGHVEFLAEAAEAIRLQAERADGQGGPEGLRGAQIPLFARIVAVAHDADVLRHPPSGAGLSLVETVERLRECAGRRYDPEAVDVFVSLAREWPTRPGGAHLHVSADARSS